MCKSLFHSLYSLCGAATLRVAVAPSSSGRPFFASEKSAPHNMRLPSLILTPTINRSEQHEILSVYPSRQRKTAIPRLKIHFIPPPSLRYKTEHLDYILFYPPTSPPPPYCPPIFPPLKKNKKNFSKTS